MSDIALILLIASCVALVGHRSGYTARSLWHSVEIGSALVFTYLAIDILWHGWESHNLWNVLTLAAIGLSSAIYASWRWRRLPPKSN